MLRIVKTKLQRAEQQERLARLISLRRADEDQSDTQVAQTLLPHLQWAKAAEAVRVPLAHIAAVATVESAGTGFAPDGRLIVLYEPHVAYRQAARPKEAARADPDLFYPAWIDPATVARNQWHPYRTTQAERWDMIARAAAIDFDAAVDGTSWGRFQIMGYWAERLGFTSTMHMIEHLYDGEHAHLDVLIRYCRMAGLLSALRAGDWFAFSKYNSSIVSKRKEYAARLARAADRAREQMA